MLRFAIFVRAICAHWNWFYCNLFVAFGISHRQPSRAHHCNRSYAHVQTWSHALRTTKSISTTSIFSAFLRIPTMLNEWCLVIWFQLEIDFQPNFYILRRKFTIRLFLSFLLQMLNPYIDWNFGEDLINLIHVDHGIWSMWWRCKIKLFASDRTSLPLVEWGNYLCAFV